MRLDLFISDLLIMMIDVNINNRTIKVVFESNPLAVNAILLKDERSYSGLERRLQYLMDDKRPLHELIETIRIYNINTPIQYNLNINVIE